MLSLRSAAQAVPDPAVGQHDLEAEHQLAGHAVAQDRGAAGVGGEVAADRAAALRAQRHREQPAGLLGRGLHVGEHDARVDGDRAGDRVDLADRAHPAERQHDLLARARRGRRRRRGRCCRPAARSRRPASWHAATTAATSAVEPGRTTARARPSCTPVQSTTYAATSASSVRTWSAPTAVRRWSSRSVNGCSFVGRSVHHGWSARAASGKDGAVTPDAQHPVRVVQLGGLMPFVREWLVERYAAPELADLADPAGVEVAVVGWRRAGRRGRDGRAARPAGDRELRRRLRQRRRGRGVAPRHRRVQHARRADRRGRRPRGLPGRRRAARPHGRRPVRPQRRVGSRREAAR